MRTQVDQVPTPTSSLPTPAEPASAPAAALPAAAPAQRCLTLRAVLVALLISCSGVVLACYHDGTVVERNITSHDYSAPLLVGLSFLFLLLVNSGVHRLRRRSALCGGEIAVAMTLILVSLPIARYYALNWVGTVGHTHALISRNDPTVRDLQKVNPYLALPQRAFLPKDESLNYDASISQEPGLPAPIHKVPWGTWLRPMLYWAPLTLTFLVMSIALGYVLHRQWAVRELVPFPLAEFVASMVQKRQERAFPDIFYNRLFWVGFGLMIFIFGINGLHAHFEKMIEFPIRYSYTELAKSFPFLNYSREGYSILRGWFYFTVIAAAVLLPAEISFTSWFSWPIMIALTYLYYDQTGQRFGDNQNSLVQGGAWWAMALLILYAGRTQYLAMVKRSVGLGSREMLEPHSVWMFRIFMVAVASMLVVLMLYGLPLDVAGMWMIATIVFLVVTSRLVAEMGVPWTPVQTQGGGPLGFMLLTMGEKALGPRIYSLLAIFNSMTMPSHVSNVLVTSAVCNGAQVEARLTGRNPSVKVVFPFLGAVLVFSIFILIWSGYSHEGKAHDKHSRSGIGEVQRAAKSLSAIVLQGQSGQLDEAEMAARLNAPVAAGDRWAARAFTGGTPMFLQFFGFGFMLVLITGFLRLKMPRFPLHPLPFVLFGSWLMSRFWFSFLIGWLIKKAILKIGGGKLFERSRPFFVGVVIGQATILTLWVFANIVIYWQHDMLWKGEWARFLFDMYSN